MTTRQYIEVAVLILSMLIGAALAWTFNRNTINTQADTIRTLNGQIGAYKAAEAAGKVASAVREKGRNTNTRDYETNRSQLDLANQAHTDWGRTLVPDDVVRVLIRPAGVAPSSP